MEHSKIIEIKNLSFSYSSKKVLNDLSLTIEEATIHGILGDNGAGKTTLFNLLFGSLSTDNQTIALLQNTYKEISYLETDTFFYSYMTGNEYLSLLTQFSKADLNKWNEIFELPLKEYVHSYSTGMKKKLSILGVLLLNKKIIILDEPFNGLDLKTCEIINYIIQRLKQIGKTVILSSHILETVVNNADKISFLEFGTITKTYDKSEFENLTDFVKSKFRNNITSEIDKLLHNDNTTGNSALAIAGLTE
jgi:ABC-2 type transport system ATP-binding protein